MNTVKTTLLLGLMSGLILVFGQALGGRQGLIIALVFAAVMNFGTYWFSDKIVLARYRAEPATPEDHPTLHAITERLVQRAGLPKPALYVLPSATPNAFATGRNPDHAAVAVTQGLLELLDEEELEGVVAHELAHVENRDTLISAVAATLASAIMVLASLARWTAIFGGFGGRDRGGGNVLGLLAMTIVAPIAALLVRTAISRTREFKADSTGAAMANNPAGLAAALRKLEAGNRRSPDPTSSATAHMFIVNPLAGGGISRFFSTHPPTGERVERLLGRR